MKILTIAMLAIAALAAPAIASEEQVTSFHDLTANTLDGAPKKMADYRGKVLVVVNTASECGYSRSTPGCKSSTRAAGIKGWSSSVSR